MKLLLARIWMFVLCFVMAAGAGWLLMENFRTHPGLAITQVVVLGSMYITYKAVKIIGSDAIKKKEHNGKDSEE